MDPERPTGKNGELERNGPGSPGETEASAAPGTSDEDFRAAMSRTLAHRGALIELLRARVDKLEQRLEVRAERSAAASAGVSSAESWRRQLADALRVERTLRSELDSELLQLDAYLERALVRDELSLRPIKTPFGRARARVQRVIAGRLVAAGLRAHRAQKRGRARRLLRCAVRRSPDNAMAWLYSARLERDDGNPLRSLADASAALVARPGWAPAVWHAADLRARLGYSHLARLRLEAYEPSPDEDKEHLLRVGRLALRLDTPRAAQRIADELKSRYSDDADVAALTVAARAAKRSPAHLRTDDEGFG
jgi:hypothetical protein